MNDSISDEFVLVFPEETISRVGPFEGLRFSTRDYLAAIEDVSSFMPRATAETKLAFKQVIPYTLVVCGTRVLSYRRGPESAERRLVGNRSLGIGGHVSTHDPSVSRPTIEEAIGREIAEELQVQSDYRMARVAVLNDNSDEVGRVHFGVIHVLLLDKPAVLGNEDAITELRFEDKTEISCAIDRYESWSRICIRSLDSLLAAAHAAVQPAH